MRFDHISRFNNDAITSLNQTINTSPDVDQAQSTEETAISRIRQTQQANNENDINRLSPELNKTLDLKCEILPFVDNSWIRIQDCVRTSDFRGEFKRISVGSEHLGRSVFICDHLAVVAINTNFGPVSNQCALHCSWMKLTRGSLQRLRGQEKQGKESSEILQIQYLYNENYFNNGS